MSLRSPARGPGAVLRPTRRARPTVESIEPRVLPATTFVLDFTPDWQVWRRRGMSFYESVAQRYTNGRYPAFVDFNRDGRFNSRDIEYAREDIAARVYRYFRPFRAYGVTIARGDALSDTNWGQQWVRYGRQSREQVFVLYLGGYSRGGEWGKAPQAWAGTNAESFGRVYVGTIINWYMRYQQNSSPATVAASIASTAAHEFGHMLGLGHRVGAASTDLMSPSRKKGQDGLYDRSYVAEVYDSNNRLYRVYQNPYREVARSLYGQPSTYGGGVVSDRALPSGTAVSRAISIPGAARRLAASWRGALEFVPKGAFVPRRPGTRTVRGQSS